MIRHIRIIRIFSLSPIENHHHFTHLVFIHHRTREKEKKQAQHNMSKTDAEKNTNHKDGRKHRRKTIYKHNDKYIHTLQTTI
jgi:hypothetical protein